MTGEMTIKATTHGYGIDADFENVSIKDKMELLHTVATTMKMAKSEILLFCELEHMGVFADAQTEHPCEDDAQMERMLQGEAPKGESKPATLDDVLNALHELGKWLKGEV